MPRYNVELNGKWACFSTVSDEFITPFMDLETYNKWRKEAYGKDGLLPIEKTNRMTYEEAIEAIGGTP